MHTLLRQVDAAAAKKEALALAPKLWAQVRPWSLGGAHST